MKNLKAILFDFDGVIGKTMEEHCKAWIKAMAEIGIHITPDDYYPLEGMKLEKIAQHLCEKYSSNYSNYPAIVESKKNNYLKSDFKFYEGILKLIDKLKAENYKLAIVTASIMEQLEPKVGKDFLSKFDCIVSGKDCNLGKPNPEPYQKAMDKLGLSSSECVVIENAPLGIKSAKSAGCYCIAVASTVDKNKLTEAGADEIIDNISMLNFG